jgi:hypothetical protein
MAKTVRKARARSKRVIDMSRPFSNFGFVDDEFNGTVALKRIMSQVRRRGGRTIVWERLYRSTDVREENEDLRLRRGPDVKSDVIRLGFFAVAPNRLRSASDDDFLGYAVLKTDRLRDDIRTRVFESVIRTSDRPNNFVRGQQRWQCIINDKNFHVSGYLFAEQNGFTNVCAHVALRTLIARFRPDQELTYRSMNNLIQVDHVSKKVGSDEDAHGLSSSEITSILKSAGIRSYVREFGSKNRIGTFQHFVYGSVESGFPAIIFFGTTHGTDSYHAIPVFGHTFNEDAWAPIAELTHFSGRDIKFIPSHAWVSMFLGHDDGAGSNICIPQHYLDTKRHMASIGQRSKGLRPAVEYIIGTLPEEVIVTAAKAELIGADSLEPIFKAAPDFEMTTEWATRFRAYQLATRLVVRAILVTKAEYISHLRRLQDWSRRRLRKSVVAHVAELFLPDEYLWLVEFSHPELFSGNLRKLGEVVVYAQRPAASRSSLSSFVLARLPNSFVFRKTRRSEDFDFVFLQSGTQSHVQLFGCE